MGYLVRVKDLQDCINLLLARFATFSPVCTIYGVPSTSQRDVTRLRLGQDCTFYTIVQPQFYKQIILAYRLGCGKVDKTLNDTLLRSTIKWPGCSQTLHSLLP
jgi:hypothetical protein